MPAEKGIPKPEASARRLDVRNYDSREAWGWLSEDERLIMSKEGVAYVDVELVCLKFDDTIDYNRKHRVKMGIRLAIILTIIIGGIITIQTVEQQPSFVCDDGITKIDYEMVLDDKADCPDGSDESTSSIWAGSDDKTRPESFQSEEANKLLYKFLIAIAISCIIGAFIPMAIWRVSPKPKEEFERKFNSMHNANINTAKKLCDVHNRSKKKIEKLNRKRKSKESERTKLIKEETELAHTLIVIRVITARLKEVEIEIGALIETIDRHWDSIKDLVPHGDIFL